MTFSLARQKLVEEEVEVAEEVEVEVEEEVVDATKPSQL